MSNTVDFEMSFVGFVPEEMPAEAVKVLEDAKNQLSVAEYFELILMSMTAATMLGIGTPYLVKLINEPIRTALEAVSSRRRQLDSASTRFQ